MTFDVATVSVAAVVFASTNIDDIVLLAVFFADPAMKPRAVIVGQYLGIGALVLASAIAAAAATAVPPGWTALLGVFPLGLGLLKLWALLKRKAPDEGEVPAQPTRRSQVIAVAAVTIANGADNLGVYIPLFATTPSSMPVYVLLFGGMTALWLFAAHAVVKHRAIGARLEKYAHAIVPFVLIALGLHILMGLKDL